MKINKNKIGNFVRSLLKEAPEVDGKIRSKIKTKIAEIYPGNFML